MRPSDASNAGSSLQLMSGTVRHRVLTRLGKDMDLICTALIRAPRLIRAILHLSCGLLAQCFGVCAASGLAQADGSLIAEVREGNRAARQSIRTFSTSFEITSDHPTKSLVMSGKYWREGNVARLLEGKEGLWTEDFLVKNDEIRQVGRLWGSNGKIEYSAVRKGSAEFLSIGDIWREMMIDFVGPNGGQVSHDRMLEVVSGTPVAKRVKLEGRECIRLDAVYTTNKGRSTNFSLWYDVGYNYLVRQMEARYSAGVLRDVVEITEFAEAMPGVYFSVKCRRTSFRGDVITARREATLSDLVVNEPLPRDTMLLPSIPSGTVLNDEIKGVRGAVGPDWRPLGAMRPTTSTRLPPASSPPLGDSDDGLPQEQTRNEEWSLGSVVIGVSVFTLAVTICYAVYRRKRRLVAE